jgi:Holliday junction resolvase RusA-like endonuclease
VRIEFEFPGPPVPWARPGEYKGRRYNPEKYSKYKADLARAIKAEYGYFAWDIPAKGTKERTRYYKNNQYSLSVQVFREKDRGDLSNYTKCVEDALKLAGVIGDDCQIKEYKEPFGIFIDKENPRVHLILESLK